MVFLSIYCTYLKHLINECRWFLFLFAVQNHGLENPYAILFHSRMDKEECRYWKRFAHTTNFYQLLGESKLVTTTVL